MPVVVIVVALLQVASHLMVGLCPPSGSGPQPASKVKRTVITRVCDAVKAIAVCHNVTPVYEGSSTDTSDTSEQSDTEVDQQSQQRVSYQASSPDEVKQYFHYLINVKVNNEQTWLSG